MNPAAAAPVDALPAVVERLRAPIEERLQELWNSGQSTTRGSGTQGRLSETPDGLSEALRYALLSPGKRIRPILVLAALDAAGGTVDDASRDVACAFELVHAYSLVHDDLPAMDDDDLRRGRATTHVHYDEATAILVGDALQAEAFALVARALAGRPGSLVAGVVLVLACAAGSAGMVGGQFLDVSLQRSGDDLAALRDLHDRKTGALLAGSIEVGAMLAGLDDDAVAAYATFGRELGWLFQLVDDLLDQVGDSARTGKATGRDQRHDKVTAIAVFGSIDALQRACDEQLTRCVELAGHLPSCGTSGGGCLADIARYVRGRDR